MWKKIVGYSALGIFCVTAAGAGYLYLRKPASQPASAIRVRMTPDRIARGEYIYALADCDGCHSPHDNSKLYFPVAAGKRASGQKFPDGEGPGQIVAPNITPHPASGIGRWTDGEKIRAIREGIGRDGRALFPMMPYELYRHMSDDDVESLVAFLNTLDAVQSTLPPTKINFPVSLLMKGSPRPVTAPVPTPPRSNQMLYGEYLVTVGVCEGCHTPFESGSFDMSKRLAGGRRFNFDGFTVVSANLTPDKDTGIGNWTEEYFLNRFRRHRNVPVEALPPVTKEQFTLMPWRNLATLDDADLLAMFTYLKSRPPVVHKVVVHPVEVAHR